MKYFILFIILIIFIIKIFIFKKNSNIKKEKLCIIGGGLSGIISAKQLKKKYNVTLFDENETLGGANCWIKYNNKYIDNGVFYLSSLKYKNYNIMNILNKYNIKYKDIEFSFNILNYSKNIYKKEITKFLKELNENKDNEEIRINDILKNYDKEFIENYIMPISTIILACDLNLFVSDFYYLSEILPFAFENKPKWIIPENGTYEMIKKLSNDISDLIKLNEKIVSVKNVENNKIEIINNNNEIYLFDKVVFCIRFDIINNIYKSPSVEEKQIYSKFKYYNVETIIHTDSSIFENNKISDYLIYNSKTKNLTIIVDKKNSIYISILKSESINNIDKNKILDIKRWKHIISSKETINNRKLLHKLQGKNNVYYSGIEMNNNSISIESSVLSGYYISEVLGVKYPSIFNLNIFNNISAYIEYLEFKKNLTGMFLL